ncbi:MAG: dienelactone hydrolase family protein [Candidatus Eremiobacteraeota bacterium]|nr:dienelactone hydrolase family protein [Candidatus Eremiobacteraeota bacterium]
MQTQALTIAVDGSPMPSFLARPDGDEPRAAVIVLQEIFGVNAEVRRIAELLAGAGYVALAINYYHRTHPDLNEPYTPEGLQAGFAAAAHITRATLRADVSASIAYLNGLPYVKHGKIATVGFCMGGAVAFVTSTLPGLTCAIPFYGGSIANGFPSGEAEGLADTNDVRVPLLLFFGGQDDYISADAVKRIDETLTAAGKTHEVVVYPDVGHAFFRESSAALDSGDVADAWRRVRAFLAEHDA